MAEEKKKKLSKKTTDKKENVKIEKSVKKEQSKPVLSDEEILARTQRRSLIMFISAVILTAVIFIPGDLVWLWLHNSIRGMFSFLALFWPLLLLFLAIAEMLDTTIPKLWWRTGFIAGMVTALNALIYIYTFDEDKNIKQVLAEGVLYKGGGVWGYIFGMPFVKLFGITPARILIILVLVVLAVFALDIPVKKLYTYLFDHAADWFKGVARDFKRSNAKRNPVKVADDAYFDEDYDEYDLNEPDQVRGSDLDDNKETYDSENPSELYDAKDEEDELQEADIDAVHELFEEDDTGENEQEYSIDIDIEEPAVDESKSDAEDYTDSELTDGLFDDVLFDDDQPDASKVAQKISMKKQNPVKSDPMQKQFDPQTVPVKNDISGVLRKPQSAPVNSPKPKPKYKYPPVTLLSESVRSKVSYKAELKESAQRLIDTLDSFSVGAKIVGYCRGPSITRYEIKPAPGVKIARITSLSDDIALGLAADAVRIEAPIPGKPAIGIEVPNKTVTSVTMRELIDSDEFRNHKSKLACVLGRDVSDQIVVMDLASMPHLLIAGTTGSGKSVCVNSILMSILFKASPDEVKMIMIDPKMVEFTKYKGIPHLLVPVVTDQKKSAGALNWAVKEMEERYNEFSMHNVKDIDSYNALVERNLLEYPDEEYNEEQEKQDNGEVVNGEYIPPMARKKMPKIVIAIDELADLMMVAPGEVEESICRLAQKARAAGMHLVIATQRPSVNIITGVIKANIPSRISLKVASAVDSKTILDMGGGEKLIGKGDMLFKPVEAPKPLRVQGGFSSDADIEAVTNYIKQHASSEYDDSIVEEIDRIAEESINIKGGPKSGGSDDDSFDDVDPMLEQAIDIVVNAGQASTSLLQRKLKVGYARAGRMIDTMEQMGIVGPHEGSKSRKVLITPQQNMERKLNKNG